MSAPQTPQQAIAALLDRYQPGSLLLVGAGDIPAVAAFAEAHPASHIHQVPAEPLDKATAAQRFELALLVDCLEHLPKRTGLELLGGIRNLNASRLAVLADLNACGWQEADFFALGLRIDARFQREEQCLHLFSYDLHDYKQIPDWLNAKFWANPENFGKYWW
ncbi:hypothetical protein A9179_08165 [Pseudomonas alcaligenes]|uniref:Uncharacterized protein n=1 Tax=Aquipseudomonas alcaligenes TaxID=43263 RepID=A0ABR7S0K6_AQUAC|nr:DUF6231 family protein [Pseudomonas alcaligenes]MBC9250247.1 hypothetical protein [Pseudomonas alcaligenes]